MKYDVDVKLMCQVVITLIISVVVGCVFYSMVSMGNRNISGRADKIKEVIDKALIQCYAQEGSFPAEVRYLQKYGVIFEEDKYEYYYEIFGVNYMPQVKVIPKG